MTELRTIHTADLDAATRSAIRGLLDAAFGEVSDDTYENVLGGMHTLVLEDGALVGHASVVPRGMLHGGRALRTGYIEGVAVRDGPLSALTPEGTRRTPDADGTIWVLPAAEPLDLSGDLTCDWRPGSAW
jgi:aminoglycoside 2'-N-acetyltransferase I